MKATFKNILKVAQFIYCILIHDVLNIRFYFNIYTL